MPGEVRISAAAMDIVRRTVQPFSAVPQGAAATEHLGPVGRLGPGRDELRRIPWFLRRQRL